MQSHGGDNTIKEDMQGYFEPLLAPDGVFVVNQEDDREVNPTMNDVSLKIIIVNEEQVIDLAGD